MIKASICARKVTLFLVTFLFASIAQWLEPRPSNIAVLGSSPGEGRRVPTRVRSS